MRRGGLAFAVLAVLVAIAGCARDDAPDVPVPAAEPPGEAASGAETFFRYGLTELDPSRDGLAERFGRPDSVSTEPIQNRHDPAITDSIVKVHYPGLTVELYLVTQASRELASSVRVTDNRYIDAESPIRIGTPNSELPVIMGEPTETEGSTRIYLCDTCTVLGNEHVFVESDGGRVSAITIQYSIE